MKYSTMKMIVVTLIFCLFSTISFAETADKYLEMGKDKLESRDYNQALSYFDKAIELNPSFADAYYYRAISTNWIESKKADVAEDLAKAIKLSPNDIKYLTARGSFFKTFDNYDQALEDYSRIIELFPNNPHGYCIKGRINQIELDNYEEAIKYYSKTIKVKNSYYEEPSINKMREGISFISPNGWNIYDGNCDLVYIFRAQSYNEIGKIGLAISDYTKHINILRNAGEDSSSYIFSRVLLLKKNNQHLEAIQDLNTLIKEDPDNILYYSERGDIKLELGDQRGAISDYSKAIEKYNKTIEKYNKMSEYAIKYRRFRRFAIRDTYKKRGMVRINLNNLDSGCLDLSKSGELGNPFAYRLINKHCN